jgi:prepilin-type processing-associated H-X9-DG protein
VRALSSAKYQGKNAVCKNNLRQIFLATQMYVSTHNVFPAIYQVRPEWQSWPRMLELPIFYENITVKTPEPFIATRLGGVFRCPLLRSRAMTLGQRDVPIPISPSYGYNAWGIGDDSFGNRGGLGLGGKPYLDPAFPNTMLFKNARDTSIRNPVNMIALGDNFCRSRNPALDATINTDTVIQPTAPIQWPSGTAHKKQADFLAHRGRANRAFVDGHQEIEDLRPNFRATDAQLARWNIDNLPHREYLSD